MPRASPERSVRAHSLIVSPRKLTQCYRPPLGVLLLTLTIERPTAIQQNGTIVSHGYFTVKDCILKEGASETLLVPVPTNQPSWRISLSVKYPESVVRRVVRETIDFAHIKQTTFGFRSDSIQE